MQSWKSLISPDLFCQLLDSAQPVFNITDSSLDICGLLSHATGHLYDTLHSSITQVFHLEIQCSHIGLAFQLWKLETVKTLVVKVMLLMQQNSTQTTTSIVCDLKANKTKRTTRKTRDFLMINYIIALLHTTRRSSVGSVWSCLTC